MYTQVGPETSRQTEEPIGLAEKITNHVKAISEQISNLWKSLPPSHQRTILIVAVFLLALTIIPPAAIALSTPARTEKSGNNVISNKSKDVQPGAKPTKQKVFVSLCGTNPCQNNARCISGINEYACKCQDGYYGDNCEKGNNFCDTNPCENNGTCISGNDDYACKCQYGYHGNVCDKKDDPCDSNPCENNGTCGIESGDYACICQNGYRGRNCSDINNPCDSNPCENNGTCVEENNDYRCNCQTGYHGKYCANRDNVWYNPGNGYRYFLIETDHNWFVSRAMCNAMGADLAVHGMKDLALRRQIMNTLGGFQYRLWMGLVDIQTENTFVWLDGSVGTSSDIHWFTYEPDSHAGDEDCANIEQRRTYQTSDWPCTSIAYALCEKLIV